MTLTIDVSVIIPTYNREEYLRQAIASCVVGNDEIDVEVVVVVVDGSTDGTRNYLINLDDERVRPIFQNRQGGQVARNRGLQEARGRYVKFLDDDDLLEPGALAKQFDTIVSEEADVCLGDLRVSEKGKESVFEQSLEKDLIASIFKATVCTHPHVFLYRRAFILQHGVTWVEDIPFHQDTHFAISVASYLPIVAKINGTVGVYRLHDGERISDVKSRVGIVKRKKAKIQMMVEGLGMIKAVEPYHTRAALSGIWREAHIIAGYDLDAFKWAYDQIQTIDASYVPERHASYLSLLDKIVGTYRTEQVLYTARTLKNALR